MEGEMVRALVNQFYTAELIFYILINLATFYHFPSTQLVLEMSTLKDCTTFHVGIHKIQTSPPPRFAASFPLVNNKPCPNMNIICF